MLLTFIIFVGNPDVDNHNVVGDFFPEVLTSGEFRGGGGGGCISPTSLNITCLNMNYIKPI